MAKKKQEEVKPNFDGIGVVVNTENRRHVLRVIKYDSATGQTQEVSKNILTDSKLSTILKSEIKLNQLLNKELK